MTIPRKETALGKQEQRLKEKYGHLMKMNRRITIQLTPHTFKVCVGRAPKSPQEMADFASLWKEYEWEDLINGDWSDHFDGGE
tara:strand:+ start:653 stop:901 length:249 start_codon:yes stop_codon:yes gene_type:complete